MMAMTTNNSMRVKPPLLAEPIDNRDECGFLADGKVVRLAYMPEKIIKSPRRWKQILALGEADQLQQQACESESQMVIGPVVKELAGSFA